MSQATAPSEVGIATGKIFDEFYAENLAFLVDVATREFKVPESEAEALAHEVFLSYFRNPGGIVDVHAWILGAICHASRYYWRQHGRYLEPLDEKVVAAQPDPATSRIADTLPDQLAAREALELLAPREQQLLQLRYFEGCSIVEIAHRLDVKPKYAQKLLARTLRRAERLIMQRSSKPRRGKAESVRDALAGFVDAYRKVD